jgi:hypothetical protein
LQAQLGLHELHPPADGCGGLQAAVDRVLEVLQRPGVRLRLNPPRVCPPAIHRSGPQHPLAWKRLRSSHDPDRRQRFDHRARVKEAGEWLVDAVMVV